MTTTPDTPPPASDGPGLFARALALPLIGGVLLYRVTLSPLMGGRCRFHPTCSEYALLALRRHGGLRGGALTLRRLLRCHPWGGSGYDPPPV